jgi:hypothetical protein
MEQGNRMTTDINQLVTQLQRVGLRPTEQQWATIKEAGATAESALLDLALDKISLGKTEPTSLGPIHALRLLGEINTVETSTIEQLLHVLPMDDFDPASQAPFVWRQDLPQIIGRWGQATIELAQPLGGDTTAPPAQRVLAIDTLGYAVEVEPTLRDDVVAFLRQQLATVDEPLVGASIVRTLSLLHVGDAYKDVMEAYKRGVVDREVIPATEARQQLLNPRLKNNLGCVSHTLVERY